MKASAPLNAIDRTILEVMKRRGRVRNNELAAIVGLSQSACLERVRRLEREGYILGYSAILSEAARGGGFEAWIEISLGTADKTLGSKVARLLSTSPHVLIADRVIGAGDWIVRFSGHDLSVWRCFCADLETAGIPVGGIRMSLILNEDAAVTSVQDFRSLALEE